MFTISDIFRPDRLTRRQALQVGALGTIGLSLPQLLQAETSRSRQRSCILIFANGGPAQLDTFDMKPDAPVDVRGEFKPIATTVPGIQIVEHLPKLAKLAQHFALVRSVNHTMGPHPGATYVALTGFMPTRSAPAQPGDFPAVGSVLATLRPSNPKLPSYVLEPHFSYDVGNVLSGQLPGWLGSQGQPFVVEGDPNKKDFKVNNLALLPGLDRARLADRRRLSASIDSRLDYLQQSLAGQGLDNHYQHAYDLISSPDAKRAFDLTQESTEVRDSYGRNQLGQSYLLARRLVEAGVRIVMVNDSQGKVNNRWDTHSDC